MTKSTKTDDKDTHAFACLGEFVQWWEAFKASHCEGIDATYSVGSRLVIQFRFQRGFTIFKYSLDVRDRYIPKALFEMQVGLLKLQAVSPTAKLNDSES
jgi:hypothetical protein